MRSSVLSKTRRQNGKAEVASSNLVGRANQFNDLFESFECARSQTHQDSLHPTSVLACDRQQALQSSGCCAAKRRDTDSLNCGRTVCLGRCNWFAHVSRVQDRWRHWKIRASSNRGAGFEPKSRSLNPLGIGLISAL